MELSPWTEEDANTVVKFLNFIALHAEFKMNTSQALEYTKFLSYSQHTLLKKIHSSIAEVDSVQPVRKDEKPSEPTGKKSTGKKNK